ncbi:MAG: hypothetical protein ABIK33_04165 [candidate division WOR-3 bacterium]
MSLRTEGEAISFFLDFVFAFEIVMVAALPRNANSQKCDCKSNLYYGNLLLDAIHIWL